MQTVGSRAQVWHGTAKHTSGGLTKKNLMQNKWGRIVSAKKHKTAKKQKRLEKAGFFAKKGEFGVVKRETMRGGGAMPGSAMSGYGMSGSAVGGTDMSTSGMSGSAVGGTDMSTSGMSGSAVGGTGMSGSYTPLPAMPGSDMPGSGMPGSGMQGGKKRRGSRRTVKNSKSMSKR